MVKRLVIVVVVRYSATKLRIIFLFAKHSGLFFKFFFRIDNPALSDNNGGLFDDNGGIFDDNGGLSEDNDRLSDDNEGYLLLGQEDVKRRKDGKTERRKDGKTESGH